MDRFFQAVGAVLVTIVLCMTVSAQNKSFSAVLSMVVCVMALILGCSYLEPVLAFLEELETLGRLSGSMVKILLKTALIGIITEVAGLLCIDGGNQSLAQSLRILSSGVILWLSLPVFQGLLELVQNILEGV